SRRRPPPRRSASGRPRRPAPPRARAPPRAPAAPAALPGRPVRRETASGRPPGPAATPDEQPAPDAGSRPDLEQRALGDRLEGQRPVADLLEQHDDAVALVPHHRPRPPL